MRPASGEYVNIRHLQWWIGEPVPDPEMDLYEVLPYAPADAERIIERLCGLAGLDVREAGNDPERAEQVRQAFGFIVDAARARDVLLDLSAIETGSASRRGATCSRNCVSTAAGLPPRSATRAPASSPPLSAARLPPR